MILLRRFMAWVIVSSAISNSLWVEIQGWLPLSISRSVFEEQ
jgi:hypothetical protein